MEVATDSEPVVKLEPEENNDFEEETYTWEESTIVFTQCLVCHKTIAAKDTCCAGADDLLLLIPSSTSDPIIIPKTKEIFRKKPGPKFKVGPGPFTCLFCSKVCRLKQQLDVHLLTHIQEKPHNCKHCPWAFSDNAALRRHRMAKHNGGLPGRHKCHYCPKLFYHPGHRATHERYHTGEKPYKCDRCPKRYTILPHLQLHVRSVHTGERPYKCTICQKGFCSLTGLKFHHKSHSEEKGWICKVPDCGAKFKYTGALKRHMMAVHTGERPFSCKWCGRRFVDHSDLNRHVRVHEGDKRYICVFCQRAFTQSGVLWVHLRVHLGEKPFQCPECDKVFPSNTDMTKHRRVHNKLMEYQCVFCSKLYKQKKSMERHLLRHINEKPENCQLCGESFRGKDMRNTHLRLVHSKLG